jgi:hypothetical protein
MNLYYLIICVLLPANLLSSEDQVSVPVGGSKTQVLKKSSDADYEVHWDEPIAHPHAVNRLKSFDLFSHPRFQLIYENARRTIAEPTSIYSSAGTNSKHAWLKVPAMSEGRTLDATYHPDGYMSFGVSAAVDDGAVDTSPYALIDYALTGAMWAKITAQAITQPNYRQTLVLRFIEAGTFLGIDVGQGSIEVYKANSGIKTSLMSFGESTTTNPLYLDSSILYELTALIRRCHVDYASSGYLLEVYTYGRRLGYMAISEEIWQQFFATPRKMGLMIGNSEFRLYGLAAGVSE